MNGALESPQEQLIRLLLQGQNPNPVAPQTPLARSPFEPTAASQPDASLEALRQTLMGQAYPEPTPIELPQPEATGGGRYPLAVLADALGAYAAGISRNPSMQTDFTKQIQGRRERNRSLETQRVNLNAQESAKAKQARAQHDLGVVEKQIEERDALRRGMSAAELSKAAIEHGYKLEETAAAHRGRMEETGVEQAGALERAKIGAANAPQRIGGLTEGQVDTAFWRGYGKALSVVAPGKIKSINTTTDPITLETKTAIQTEGLTPEEHQAALSQAFKMMPKSAQKYIMEQRPDLLEAPAAPEAAAATLQDVQKKTLLEVEKARKAKKGS